MTNKEINVAAETLVAAFLDGKVVDAELFDSEKVMIQKGVRKLLKKAGKKIVETEGGYQAADEAPKKPAKKKVPGYTDTIGAPVPTAGKPPVFPADQAEEAKIPEGETEDDFGLQVVDEQALDTEIQVALSAGPTARKVYEKADDLVSRVFREQRKMRVGDKRVTFAKNCSQKDFATFPEWLAKNQDKYAAAVVTRVGKDYEGQVFALVTDLQLGGELLQALSSLQATGYTVNVQQISN